MEKQKILNGILIIILISVLSVIGYTNIKDSPCRDLITADNAEKAVYRKDTVYEDVNLIDINNATEAELVTLPGIGTKKAVSIVELRQKMYGFSSVEDLLCVDGIGKQTLEKLLPLVCVKDYTEK